MKVLAIFSLFLACVVCTFARQHHHHQHQHEHETTQVSTSPPQYKDQYFLGATIVLPYLNVAETVTVYYDGANGAARIEFDGGLDTYIYRTDINMTWQVSPVVDTLTCFANPGQTSLVSYIPDLTGFQLQNQTVNILGVPCDDWQLNVTIDGVTSYYNFYTFNNVPVQYVMMGFDSLLGSHYDKYVVTYTMFQEGSGSFGPSTFTQPTNAGQCTSQYDGTGRTFVDPALEIESIMPSTAQLRGQVTQEFRAFMDTHGKNYATLEEMRARQAIYEGNKRYINAHNRANKSYRMAINHLADQTKDELKMRKGLLRTRPVSNNAMGYHQISGKDLPQFVNWTAAGAVNPPQDQGICGSCWSFGSTGAIEGAYAVKYGELQVLSEQELMDCSWPQGNNACNGGLDFQAYDWIMSNGGISWKKKYGPYLMVDGYCQASRLSPDVQISGYVNVTSGNETALLDALFTQGPVSVSIDASHQSFSFYSSGVYYEPQCQNGVDDLDHSVLAVGYGTDPVGGDYWIVKNSWSTYWGDLGFVKMSRTNNNCGVATSPTYVLVQ